MAKMHVVSREELQAKYPWIRQYKTKQWRNHRLSFPDDIGDYHILQSCLCDMEERGLVLCGAGSQLSVNHIERGSSVNDLFLFDLEEMEGMGLPEVFGPVDFGSLTEEWRGYPKGSLVLSVFVWNNGRNIPSAVLVGTALYAPTPEKDGKALEIAREELAKGVSEEEVVDMLHIGGDYSAHQAVELVRMAKKEMVVK